MNFSNIYGGNEAVNVSTNQTHNPQEDAMQNTAIATQEQARAANSANERTEQNFAATVRVKDAHERIIDFTFPSTLKPKVVGEYLINTRDGRQLPAILFQGWTGSPEYFEFVPGWIREDGTLVQDRFTCHILTGDDETMERETHRTNFWGPLAKAAHATLVANQNGPQVAFIRILGGTVSTYRDPYGIGRASVNVNFERQYKPLHMHTYKPAGSGFFQAAQQSTQPEFSPVVDSNTPPF